MAEENKNLNTDTEVETTEVKAEKKVKANAPAKKGPNFFVRTWNKLTKLCKDTAGELKKVVWTPKAEVIKNFKLVISTVVALAAVILVIDLASSFVINTIAGLIG